MGTLEWIQKQGASVPSSLLAGAQQQQRQQGGAAPAHEQLSLPPLYADHAGAAEGSGQGGSSSMAVGNSHSRVYVSVDGRLVGAIDVQDAVRQDARLTVADLQVRGAGAEERWEAVAEGGGVWWEVKNG